MNPGWYELCLKCNDVNATKDFYVALGMDVVHDSEHWVHPDGR
jgi:catechol 2,3-dioxygenase-like lactoylglutathione lyase family enzyme